MLLPLALVALAGCAKVEVEEAPAKMISFQAVNYSTQTKAAVAVTEFTEFQALGFLHAEGVDIVKDNGEWTDQGSYQPFFGSITETATTG